MRPKQSKSAQDNFVNSTSTNNEIIIKSSSSFDNFKHNSFDVPSVDGNTRSTITPIYEEDIIATRQNITTSERPSSGRMQLSEQSASDIRNTSKHNSKRLRNIFMRFDDSTRDEDEI